MYGFKKGEKPEKVAKSLKGGKINGPGTGTSDSIRTEVPRGSYIMPADSTAKIGEKALGQLGKPVPVNVSSGEYHMPPEQVHAVGVQALNQMRDATHAPVAAGFRPQESELYFADGGLIGNAAQYWAKDNANFEAGSPSFGSRFVRALNPATAFGSAMGAMHTAAGNGDKTGMALAAAQAVPVFGAMRSVVTPAMGAIKAARAVAPSAAQTGVAIAGSGAAGAMADTYGTPEEGSAPQQAGAAFSDMQREPNIPRQQAPRLGFADGGSPAEEERKRLAGEGPSPQMGSIALANQRRVERTQSGLYGTPRTQEQIQADTGLPGYQDRVNAIPGPNDNDLAGMARVNARLKPGVPATQRSTAEQPARQNYDFQPNPMQGPAMGMSVRNTSVDGIRRIDNAPGLNSPLFTNLPTGEAISGLQGGAVSTLDMSGARAAAGRGGQGLGFQPDQAQQGPRASRIGGSDTQALIDQFNKAYDQRRAAMQRRLRPGEVLARDRDYASALSSFLSSQGKRAELEQDAQRQALQSGMDQQRIDLDRQRTSADLTTKGFEARGLERVERLYQQLDAAETPEARAAIAEQLRAISGKEAPNRFTVVPGGQEIDPVTNMVITRPARVLNNQTGQFVDQQPGAQGLPPIAENPAVQKIMQNTALSREERAAQIRALGYK